VIKLIDFGIAGSIDGDATSALKTQLVGTPNYMAPEQFSVRVLLVPVSDVCRQLLGASTKPGELVMSGHSAVCCMIWSMVAPLSKASHVPLRYAQRLSMC